MVLLLLEHVPIGLRGELSRWMIEPRPGVFVGKVSAMVRDKLWDKACSGSKGGAAILIYPSPTEQGFTARTHGDPTRQLIDWEGLTLVRLPKRPDPTTTEKPSCDPAPPDPPAPPLDWIPG